MPGNTLRGFFPVGSILCCDTLLRAIQTFKTSIELIDPAQKPIPAPDTRRGEIKILDPSSSSPIHLWSK
ncbi:MAG: hypothetical protein KY448_18585, partial [Cyanobacteria bacterium 0813]|nr:hypothetical protein [Cyanobacteria bacterium 0813]